jgi:hypothetical protein
LGDELLQLAITGGAIQDLPDERDEVVEGPHRRHGRGEAVVEDASCGAEDEGVADDLERDLLLMEPACQQAVHAADVAQDGRRGAVEADHLVDVPGAGVAHDRPFLRRAAASFWLSCTR